jgi:Periplasmic component of the Tol biopolymer transport system
MFGMKVSIVLAVGLWLSTAALIFLASVSGQAVFKGEGQIAFETDRDGNWEIYTLDVRTGLVFNLSRNDAADHAPSWSPDSSRLAFHSNRGGETDIYIMNAGGNQLRRLTFTGSSWRPRWSPMAGRLCILRVLTKFTSWTRTAATPGM